jgi:predicted transposase/invertase (TIGR01784 family)
LDIDISLNDNTSIDLELQVNNEYNWTDRSLSYLCRNYDNLFKGNNYNEAGHAIHIGLLDFTPFPEAPEFYASYKLMNVKTHHLYSSKFVLNVLDLNHINLAAEEDKRYRNCLLPSQLRCRNPIKIASQWDFCTLESCSYGLSSKCFDLF